MAIDTTDSYQEFTADGQTAYFSFNFNYVDSSEIIVGKRTGDNTYVIVQPEYYQVIKNASEDGGQIRFISNPSGSQIVDNPPSAGEIIRIERNSLETSDATWQIGLEMSELIALFDKLFRLVQENTGRFDNTIETFATQHGVKLYELLQGHTDKLLYWDNDTKTITPTDFPRQDVVQSVGGLFFRIKVDESTNAPYLEWSKNGIDDWYGLNLGEVANQAKEAIETANDAKTTAESALESVNSLKTQTTKNTQDIAANRAAIGVNEAAIAANEVAITETRVTAREAKTAADDAVTKTGDMQTQIDAMAAASDVADVVGTYADLQAYDTSKLTDNAIIKILNDETQGGASTYYRWTIGA